jgi:hypothetical protein
MEPAAYTKCSPESPYILPVAGAGFRPLASHGHSMANRIALLCPRMVEPEDCSSLWNDQGASYATSQAMDVAGDLARLPRPHSLREGVHHIAALECLARSWAANPVPRVEIVEHKGHCSFRVRVWVLAKINTPPCVIRNLRRVSCACIRCLWGAGVAFKKVPQIGETALQHEIGQLEQIELGFEITRLRP